MHHFLTAILLTACGMPAGGESTTQAMLHHSGASQLEQEEKHIQDLLKAQSEQAEQFV